jgi:hypothetical protein
MPSAVANREGARWEWCAEYGCSAGISTSTFKERVMKRLFGWMLAVLLLAGVYGCGGEPGMDGADSMPATDAHTDDGTTDDSAPKTDDTAPAGDDAAPKTDDGGPTPAPKTDDGAPAPAPKTDDGAPAPAPKTDDGAPAPAPKTDDGAPKPEGGDPPAPSEGASKESGGSVFGAIGRALLKGASEGQPQQR